MIVDPKGDDAPARRGARGRRARRARLPRVDAGRDPRHYNPYAHGSRGEIADKALAGERYSEPHYLRQAQRYLAHAARALAAVGETPTPARLLELMDPRRLRAASARACRRGAGAPDCSTTSTRSDARQRAASAARATGSRSSPSRSSAAGSSPDAGAPALDLLAAVRARAVVYFRLEADRLPLLARMLAAAIVSDLVTVAASCQADPVPTLVAIDEFSAIAPEGVARLFGRARAAGFSLLLATQELADLRAARRRAARAGARQRRDGDRAPPERARLGRADRADRGHAPGVELDASSLPDALPDRPQHAHALARVRDPSRGDPDAAGGTAAVASGGAGTRCRTIFHP